MIEEEWKEAYEREMHQAETSRTAGNEGRARVCARRAAGILACQILRKNGLEPQGASALDFLQQIQELPLLDEKVRHAAGLFLQRVDEHRHLPNDIDLLAQARWLYGRV